MLLLISMVIFIFIIGLIIGSFLNAIIWRLHSGESIVFGRSMCPQCRKELSPKDLVPLFSFIALSGKCRYCGGKISWQYPAVELSTSLLFVLSFALNYHLSIFNYQLLAFFPAVTAGQLLSFIRDICLISFLTIIFVYDLRWQLIPDRVTIPAIILFFIFSLLLGASWWSILLAILIGFGFFGLQYLVSSGRWIGGGDLRLGALMGAALGWPNILIGLLAAYIIGAIVSIFLLATGKAKAKTPIAFGTFLAVGTLIALFWGQQMINWYLWLLI